MLCSSLFCVVLLAFHVAGFRYVKHRTEELAQFTTDPVEAPSPVEAETGEEEMMDTPGWRNEYNYDCKRLEMYGWCRDGNLFKGDEKNFRYRGALYNFPEINCVACGGGHRVNKSMMGLPCSSPINGVKAYYHNRETDYHNRETLGATWAPQTVSTAEQCSDFCRRQWCAVWTWWRQSWAKNRCVVWSEVQALANGRFNPQSWVPLDGGTDPNGTNYGMTSGKCQDPRSAAGRTVASLTGLAVADIMAS